MNTMPLCPPLTLVRPLALSLSFVLLPLLTCGQPPRDSKSACGA